MDIETTLNQLYNTLLTIETKGDATLKMAACIDALQKVLTDLAQKTNQETGA